MNPPPLPHSLCQIADRVAEGANFSYLLGDFLDAFYREPSSAALAEEPVPLTGRQPQGAMLDAFMAAVAQSLALKEGWPTPAWALREGRALRRPHFGVRAASLRATLLLESPPEFRARNLFVTANVLSRV